MRIYDKEKKTIEKLRDYGSFNWPKMCYKQDGQPEICEESPKRTAIIYRKHKP